MPRPKRSKVAPSAPISLRRVAQPEVAASAVQQQKNTFSPASLGRVTNGSDDSDGLVVAKRTLSRGKNVTPAEYVMSGALAPDDIGTTRLKPASSKTRTTLTRIARDADHAEAVDKAKTLRTAQTATMESEQIPSSFPQEAHPAGELAFGSSQSPAHESMQNRLGSKIQETPRMQSSLLVGANFKKRPRQPSLLQMVQSQNQIQDDVEDDDMYNFLPDDQSTPLIKSLNQPLAYTTSSSSRPADGSRKRKQATPEIQVPASQSQTSFRSSPSSLPSQPLEQMEVFDLQAEDEPQPSLPRHRSTQTPQPLIFSDTLAPPQSSSPAQSKPRANRSNPTKVPVQSKPKSRARQSKRKKPSPAPSPMSSISTQISPVRPKSMRTLTTATLQNLLPRRQVRSKAKGDFDFPSSSDVELNNTGFDEDEDELSFHATKARRKKPGMSGQKGAAKKKETLAGKKASKTYTRKSIVASEDEDDENVNASGGDEPERLATVRKKTLGLDGKARAEMKRLADKFKEVDDFSLEFEDMTGSSSQMIDAR